MPSKMPSPERDQPKSAQPSTVPLGRATEPFSVHNEDARYLFGMLPIGSSRILALLFAMVHIQVVAARARARLASVRGQPTTSTRRPRVPMPQSTMTPRRRPWRRVRQAASGEGMRGSMEGFYWERGSITPFAQFEIRNSKPLSPLLGLAPSTRHSAKPRKDRCPATRILSAPQPKARSTAWTLPYRHICTCTKGR